jgi:hypothetical protein
VSGVESIVRQDVDPMQKLCPELNYRVDARQISGAQVYRRDQINGLGMMTL